MKKHLQMFIILSMFLVFLGNMAYTQCNAPTLQPTNLILTSTTNSISGTFNPSFDADHYLIVRSTLSTLSTLPLDSTIYTVSDTLGGGTVIAYQTDTTITDANLFAGIQFYYYVFAANSLSCSGEPAYLRTSPLTGTATCSLKSLNITAILQEYYNTGTGLMNQTLGINWDTGDLFHNFGSNIVDTVTVLIRSTIPPTYIIEATFNGVNITTNGSIPTIYLNSNWSSCPYGAITGYHHIVIKHRNSIETWSDSVDFSGQQINYNFFTHTPVEFEGGMYEDANGNFEIWGGDVNQNGNLESADFSEIYLAENSYDETVNNGYVIDDIDGNGNIDSQDVGIAYNNANWGANTINPTEGRTQPTNLTLTPYYSTITGSFTASETADHYLIVRSTSGILGASPVRGTLYTAGNTIGNGVVVAYQVGTSFIDTNLNKGTYYYFIFAADTLYCTHNYLTTSPLAASVNLNCGIPTAQPTNLILTRDNTSVSGSFTASASADHYLIVRSTSATLTATPARGTAYITGNTLGDGTVVAYQTDTAFADSSLNICTQYYYTIYAANCTGLPQYLATDPLFSVTNNWLSSVDITIVKDTTYFVNSNNTWVNFIPTNDTCSTIFGVPSSSNVLIDSIYMYSGSCGSLSLINTYAINDTIRELNFENLNIDTNYYFKVKFSNVFNNLFSASIIYMYKDIIPCSPDLCNLIVNGGFECVSSDIFTTYPGSPVTYPNNVDPFHTGRVLSWEAGWGIPVIDQINSGYSTILRTEVTYIDNLHITFAGGSSIYENISQPITQVGYEYELSFSYRNYNFCPAYLNVYLANFNDIYNGSIGQVKPQFTESLQLYSNQIPYTGFWENETINFSNDNNITKLVFFLLPISDPPYNIYSPSLDIDNIFFKPKIKFNLPNPAIICAGVPTQITASLPTNITNLNWQWTSIPSGFTASTQSITVSPTATTTYTVTATGGGCTYTGSITITIDILQSPFITGNNNNCDTTNIYTTSNSFNFTWTTVINGVTTPAGTGNSVTVTWPSNINYNYPHMIIVTSVDTNGCASSDSMNIYNCCLDTTVSNINLHDTIITSSSGMLTDDLYINGTVTFDCNCEIIFMGPKVEMGPYAQIIAAPNTTLIIKKGSVFEAGCRFMWDGIYVTGGSSEVDVLDFSTIKDAINGLVSDSNGIIKTKDAYMTDNYFNIKISNAVAGNYAGTIKNTAFKFIGVNTSGNTYHFVFPPLQNTKTLVGIYCYNVHYATIGDESSSSFRNTFDKMRFGIYANNSTINVVNNEFTNILNGINPPLPTYNEPTILGTRPTYPEGAVYAISTSAFIRPCGLTVGGDGLKQNFFNSCNTGIFSYNYINNLFNSDIKDCRYGISLVNIATISNGNLTVRPSYINDNNIYGAVTPGKGISIKNTDASPLGYNCYVKRNTITDKQTGIYMIGVNSTLLTYSTVDSNTIHTNLSDPYVPTSQNQCGISVSNCSRLDISFNYINRQYPIWDTNGDYNNIKGISITASLSANVFQNTLNYMGNGIYTSGSLDITQFNCNTFNNNYYGFNFGDLSHLTNQGIQVNGINRNYNPYNQWINDAPSFPTHKRMIDNGLNFPGFHYYYAPASSIYDPTVSMPWSPWIFPIVNSGGNSLCTETGQTGPVGPISTLAERETQLGQIVRNQLIYDTLQSQYTAMAREYAYLLLANDTTIINMGDTSDYVYQAFYTTMQTSDAAHTLNAREAMYENKLDIAQQELNMIADTNAVNHNRIIVDNIYLNTWAQNNYELTKEQSGILYDIAYLDPNANGDAVYTARVMLNIDPDDVEVKSAIFIQHPKEVTPNTVHVYPNPAKETITIAFDQAILNDGIVEIWSIVGNKLLSTSIPKATAQQRVDVSSLTSGIYFYVVKINGDKLSSGKLIILNK
ncbi:MAG: T9SS type A sorting domain-containing protein [Bacteroidota bacterium]